jgi:predicted aspartyl protease
MSVYALTISTPKSKVIKTDVKISNPKSGKDIRTKGIWDTGATNSVITKSTAQALGLIPIAMANVKGVHGVKRVPVYRVRITLSNENISLETEVAECDELSGSHDTGMLVGMNIIGMGDFAISNFNGETTMTFRVPSLDKIDYESEINEHRRILGLYRLQLVHGIVNPKCPCNSGKAWQDCHGKSKYFSD